MAPMIACTPCLCDEKLAAAESELRAKANRRPDCAGGYAQAVLEIIRVRHSHFKDCAVCQAAEDGSLAVGQMVRA